MYYMYHYKYNNNNNNNNNNIELWWTYMIVFEIKDFIVFSFLTIP